MQFACVYNLRCQDWSISKRRPSPGTQSVKHLSGCVRREWNCATLTESGLSLESSASSHIALSMSYMDSSDTNTLTLIEHVCVALNASRSVAAFPQEHREKHIGLANGEDRLCTLNTGLHVVSFGGMVTLVGRGKQFVYQPRCNSFTAG